MKYIKDDNGRVTHWQAETPVEHAALEYAETHVPVVAAASPYGITAFLAGAAWQEDQPLTGADVTDGASEEAETCSCGEPITFYDGEWLHIFNPALRGTDDHDAKPGSGYYEPQEDESGFFEPQEEP